MTKPDAIKFLIQVAKLAQRGGLLTFKDAVLAFDAINSLESEAQKEKEGSKEPSQEKPPKSVSKTPVADVLDSKDK